LHGGRDGGRVTNSGGSTIVYIFSSYQVLVQLGEILLSNDFVQMCFYLILIWLHLFGNYPPLDSGWMEIESDRHKGVALHCTQLAAPAVVEDVESPIKGFLLPLLLFRHLGRFHV
jgi:hypothetical protein